MTSSPSLPSPQPADRRLTAGLTAAPWLLAVAGIVLAVLAAGEFGKLRRWPSVAVTAGDAEITVEGDLVYGRLARGLPPWRRHWDGEPPRAVLVDPVQGAAIAPPLLLESSLSLNRRGVLWTPEECRFVVERSVWEGSGGRPMLRCEAVRSSALFYGLCGAALAAGLGGILCGQVRRVVQCEAPQRPGAIAAELRTSLFVLLSLYTAAAFYPGLSFTTVGDAANINAFAAARHAPHIMQRDPLLGDPRNYVWYTPAYVEFVRWWKAAGLHYGVGTAFLALASTLAGLFGYERLFRAASGSAVFAALAAVGLWFMRASYPPNESWEIVHVLPRTVFSALAPWMVLAAVAVRARPARWCLAAAASAALFYVHPVSSPALTGAVLMGLVISGEGAWPKRLAWGVPAGGAALLVMLPYTLAYAAKYVGTVEPDPELMAQAVEAARARFAPGYLDLHIFFGDLALLLLSQPRYWIGLACAAWLFPRRGPWPVRLGLGMAAGYAIVTLAIPVLDLGLAAVWGRLPFQVDLVRNVRYLDIFVLAGVGLALRETAPGAGKKIVAALRAGASSLQIGAVREALRGAELAAAAAILVSLYLASAVGPLCALGQATAHNAALLAGDAPPHLGPTWEMLRVLQTVRRPHEVVSGPLFLRAEHIPLAWTRKDLGALAYANPRQLVAAEARLEAAEAERVWPVTMQRLHAVAASLDAQWIVLDRRLAASHLPDRRETVFQNEEYVVTRVAPAAARWSARTANPTR